MSAGYNLVLHPDVKGNVTIKLLNVPWDQALDIVLNLKTASVQINRRQYTLDCTDQGDDQDD